MSKKEISNCTEGFMENDRHEKRIRGDRIKKTKIAKVATHGKSQCGSKEDSEKETAGGPETNAVPNAENVFRDAGHGSSVLKTPCAGRHSSVASSARCVLRRLIVPISLGKKSTS